MRKVNFVRTGSSAYSGVQRQLIGLIGRHLPRGTWGQTRKRPVASAVNLSFFSAQTADVLMSHGVADKDYFFRTDEQGRKIIHNFDHAFVPGSWLRNRILADKDIRTPPGNVHIVGWPRIDELHEMRLRRPPSDRVRVLWAPTHNARDTDTHVTSSYPRFEPYIEELRRHFDVEISLHPRNRKDRTPTGEKLARCDVLISDFGTTVYEALALGIPVVFPDWIIREGVLREFEGASPAQLFKRNIGHHAESFDHLVEMIRTKPVIDAETKAYADGVIDPGTVGRSGKLVADTLLRLSSDYEARGRAQGLVGRILDRVWPR